MNFDIVIIAYYPNQLLIDRIVAALNGGFTCWIFDNTPKGNPYLRSLAIYNNCYVQNEKNINVGLGQAMNCVFKNVFNSGCSHILYFDQDTLFSLATLNWIKSWYIKNTKENYAALQFVSTDVDIGVEVVRDVENVLLLINNGCVFDLFKLNNMGWHDKTYFVEGVDYKFCLDAAYLKYKLGRVGGAPDIDHVSVQPQNSTNVFKRKFTYRIYPWLRKREFTLALLRLYFVALKRRQFLFSYIFLRNILTFWTTQSMYHILLCLNKANKNRNDNDPLN